MFLVKLHNIDCDYKYFIIYRNGKMIKSHEVKNGEIIKLYKIISPYKWRSLYKETFIIKDKDLDEFGYNDKFINYINQFNICDNIIEVPDCWVCFDSSLRTVLYFGDDKPERFKQEFNVCSKTYKKWTSWAFRDYCKKDKYISLEWKVKHPDKMFILNTGNLNNLFHDVLIELKDIDLWHLPYYRFDIYNNIEPFKMSKNYDYSEEENKEMDNRYEQACLEKEKYYEELEKRKQTPGYCSCCGEPYAMYVDNPYYLEMYGCHNKEWLCSECYNDLCNDI